MGSSSHGAGAAQPGALGGAGHGAGAVRADAGAAAADLQADDATFLDAAADDCEAQFGAHGAVAVPDLVSNKSSVAKPGTHADKRTDAEALACTVAETHGAAQPRTNDADTDHGRALA